MQRAFTLTLLMLLAGVPVQAQRGFVGGMSHGFGHSGPGVFFGARGLRSGFFPRHFRSHAFGNPGLFVGPFWYDGGFGYDAPYVDAVAPAPTPIIVTQQPQPQSAPVVAAAPPKIIEIPGVASAPTSQPSAVFVLSSGERIESSRYLLTADDLQITINHHQRTIPWSQLDMNATVSANRRRGIELKIPSDRNEITLAF